MLSTNRKPLGHPLWTWAVLLVTLLAIGLYTSWAAYDNLWSWPVLFALVVFGLSVVLEARRLRGKDAVRVRHENGPSNHLD